ncbi:MAG: hypothetical protein GY804_13765 [Alphaproteobacteria bacterium]|nr:hypothetical protein [Alphaproteobacteria bacterium]
MAENDQEKRATLIVTGITNNEHNHIATGHLEEVPQAWCQIAFGKSFPSGINIYDRHASGHQTVIPRPAESINESLDIMNIQYHEVNTDAATVFATALEREKLKTRG